MLWCVCVCVWCVCYRSPLATTNTPRACLIFLTVSTSKCTTTASACLLKLTTICGTGQSLLSIPLSRLSHVSHVWAAMRVYFYLDQWNKNCFFSVSITEEFTSWAWALKLTMLERKSVSPPHTHTHARTQHCLSSLSAHLHKYNSH